MLRLTCLASFGIVAWFVVAGEPSHPLGPACQRYSAAASAQAVRELESWPSSAPQLQRLDSLGAACRAEVGL